MMHFKKASLIGSVIESVEESDDDDLTSPRLAACRQALSGGKVTASNGLRVEVVKGIGGTSQESDRYLFSLGLERQDSSRAYMILGDTMEAANEIEALTRFVAFGAKSTVPDPKAQKTVQSLLDLRPILISRSLGKSPGIKAERALREVALGIALSIVAAIEAE